MLRRILVITLSVLILISSHPFEARARGGAIAGCATVLWEFVGKPLTGVVIEKTGGLLFDHFAERIKTNNKVVVTSQDIRTLAQKYEQYGISECELRRQLEVINYPQPSGFSAQSHCSMTGVTGSARGLQTSQQAIQGAVFDCVNRGGKRECCEHDVRLVQ